MKVRFHLEEEPRVVYSFIAPGPQATVQHIRYCIASILHILPSDLILVYGSREMSDIDTVDSFVWRDAGDSIQAKVTSYTAGCKTRPFYCQSTGTCSTRSHLFGRDQQKSTVELQFAPS